MKEFAVRTYKHLTHSFISYNDTFKNYGRIIKGFSLQLILTPKVVVITLLLITSGILKAQNPIKPGIGLCDPQIRVYGSRAYLYATHDSSINNKTFVMNNWWVWSSKDLINWRQESVLYPEQTYHRKTFNQCWATDAISRNGHYYFYFSKGPKEIGVVVGNSPNGPWHDPLGKPLIAENVTPTEARDPGILQLSDGTSYIVFGVWDFYIAKLNPDMISLAEPPRKIILDRKYGPYGEGKTDDKPFLHQRGKLFYLSWGCYYAMANNPYGPYKYKGSLINRENTDTVFRKALTYDRHGSIFKFHNQWYFMCNDQSYPGSTPHFRNSVISYLHYKTNGEIATVKLNKTGVGQYNPAKVEAEDYFSARQATQHELGETTFEVRNISEGTAMYYPHIRGVHAMAKITFRLACRKQSGAIEIRQNSAKGKVLGTIKISTTGGNGIYKNESCILKNGFGDLNICLVFRGVTKTADLRIDWFSFE